MLDTQIFSVFPQQGKTLHELALSLYEEQRRTWKMLSEGIAALDSVQLKTVQCHSYRTVIQFNPKRIVSTGAKVDAQSIAERKCFLCTENLPAEQQGILVDEKFLILCNPMPIFKHHFTISNVRHIPQSIEDHVSSLLQFAKELSPEFSVFYNGPKCGASAPDHMHFQASLKGLIPIEHELHNMERKYFYNKKNGVEWYSLKDLDRSVLVLEGENAQKLEAVFHSVVAAARKILHVDDEPLLNVICFFEDQKWKIIIIFRSKHRPDVYFKEGEEKILISPASVDIGGLIVTPMEKDFLRADAALIENIFREVSLTKQHVESIIENI